MKWYAKDWCQDKIKVYLDILIEKKKTEKPFFMYEVAKKTVFNFYFRKNKEYVIVFCEISHYNRTCQKKKKKIRW